MENKEKEKIIFSPAEQKRCFLEIKSQLIKLLYLIEEEKNGEKDIDLWFYGFMFSLASANSLCEEKLTRIIVKINGLYEDHRYRSMTHQQIKRQIMESKGILESLLRNL